MGNAEKQAELFDFPPELPHGFMYRPDFISVAEEMALLEAIDKLTLKESRYKQYTAKRRVARFGAMDDPEETDFPRLPFPPLLVALIQKIAVWLQIPESRFVHGLITHYAPGTPIGWHRDAPHFETVVGISLSGSCRMQFRPLGTSLNRKTVFALDLLPRSAYVMRGPVRWNWEHHIPPVSEVRYSITLRTGTVHSPASHK